MSDPLRTDGARAHDSESAQDRDAKIEQLLLLGLDHYFAARYELAINVWTRALFLDRSHARARAYIERARSALAERQRQSEELLHNGVAAFERGEGDEARRLLHAAIDGGAPADEALAVLERLEREAPPDPVVADRPAAVSRPPTRDRRGEPADRSPIGGRLTLGLVCVAAVAFAIYAAQANPDWQEIIPLLPRANAAPSTAPPAIAQEVALPLPRRGEMALGRARALAAGGRLHDALTALDEVRPTDPEKADADRLKAEIQRQLLALTPMPPGAASDRRQP